MQDVLTEQGYATALAQNGLEALEILGRERFDLMISDINMPKMKGYELIARSKERFPAMKSALITAYDVNDYIRYAREFNIGNIIAKTSPFNFEDFLITVDKLLTGRIFGMDVYFPNPFKRTEWTIKHSVEIETAIKEAYELLANQPKAKKIRTVIRELLVNAVFYGARNEDGARKEDWDIEVALKPDEWVLMRYLEDESKSGFAIVDQKGRLTKTDVLFWLERNIVRNADGTAINLQDIHGRGLYISREFMDQLVINLAPGRQTEVLCISYKTGTLIGHKPLVINEL
jgi:CheY-like chemotaxis protein